MKKDNPKKFLKFELGEAVPAILSVVVSLFLGGLIILIVKENPFTAYGAMFSGAFGNMDNFTSILVRQTPLLITGLAYVLAYRCGLINLGLEGQLLVGAMAAGIAGYTIKAPAVIEIPAVLLAAAIAGALWAGIAGVLRAKFGITEFLTTLMLNYVATYLVNWMVVFPFRDRTPANNGMATQTQQIVNSARLPVIWPGTRLHAGWLVGILLTVAVLWFLFKTKIGYEFRMNGFNPFFAEYGGVKRVKTIIIAMLISGAIAGIAGGVEIMGVHWKYIDAFSPGYGFDGVSSAILGNGSPIGTFIASFLFSALKTGALGMDRNTRVPFELRNVVQATVIFFMASNLFIGMGKALVKKRPKKDKEAKQGVTTNV
jgi:simple sugar transport system permease protein